MIPIKDKTYAIACMGPYDYNKYGGLGIHTGNTEVSVDSENKEITLYGFMIPVEKSECWFEEKEIICETK